MPKKTTQLPKPILQNQMISWNRKHITAARSMALRYRCLCLFPRESSTYNSLFPQTKA